MIGTEHQLTMAQQLGEYMFETKAVEFQSLIMQ